MNTESFSRLEADQTRHLYVIVDGAQLPNLKADLYLHAATPLHKSLYAESELEPLDDVAPRLISVDETGKVLDWLLAAHSQTPWGVLLTSNAGFEDVWQHLHSIAWVRRSEHGESLLRYYDPRVARELLPLEHPSIHDLMGPISQVWAILPEQSRFQKIYQTGRNELAPARPAQARGWFFLRPIHEAAIDKAAEAQREQTTAEHVQECFPEHWQSLSNPHRLIWVRTQIEQARRFGVESIQDILLFTNIACVLGEDFLQVSGHPAARLLRENGQLTSSQRLRQAAELLESEG